MKEIRIIEIIDAVTIKVFPPDGPGVMLVREALSEDLRTCIEASCVGLAEAASAVQASPEARKEALLVEVARLDAEIAEKAARSEPEKP